MYQISKFLKHVEKDIFLEGCQPDSSFTTSYNQKFKDSTIDGLIKKVMDDLNITDPKNVLIDSCGELGRLDFQVYEDSEGCYASDSEIEQWKKGKIELFLCNYVCHVQKIESVICLAELVTDKNLYSTN